ncbi:MAG TPA: FmdB family zinc ribbon protein [Terriglobales bacterium]|jgi:putative FmdB family regulatory protein|nr:FmdB family zinc ribbon protein [Terriglobales bacterium]
MPLYEYLCKKCGHRFERIQKFSDAPVKKCPECGGAVEQVLSAPAVQFKGSGWYVTDYAKKPSASSGKGQEKEKADGSGEAEAATKDEAGESKAESKAESKSESKAESKKESKKPAKK